MITLGRIRLPCGCARRELWRPRRTVVERSLGRDTVWESRDGQWRIICNEIRYGTADSHYRPRWLVLWRSDGHWWPWARTFRSPRSAFAAVERAIKGEDRESAKTRKRD